MAASSIHNGWRFDRANTRLDFYYRGTRAGHINATGASFTGTLGTTGLATLATATVTGNLTISSTLTAGADGVGSDGEQLTSGGAGAECDWSADTSLRKFKNVLRKRDNDAEVLDEMVATPVYDFTYKRKGDLGEERVVNTGDVETIYTGIMADEAPWAMHHKGKILSPISTFGRTVQAIRALTSRIEKLEAAT